MADRRAGPHQGPYVPSPGGGSEPRSRNKDWNLASEAQSRKASTDHAQEQADLMTESEASDLHKIIIRLARAERALNG